MMSDFWKDKDRRRGAIGSIVIHIVLLLIFLFFGLSYMEPKPEDGIVINFGNSETGFGEQADGAPQPVSSPPKSQNTPEQEQTPTEQTETPTATQDVVDAPALEEKNEKPEKTKPKEEKQEKKAHPRRTGKATP
ncbi:MAG: hypothetical protein U5L96_18620 [Owenweeksia sp.]|nr:hypothetical protein [Owenweeksia sp.]